MTMDSDEFNKLMLAFGADIDRVSDALHLAKSDDIPEADKAAAIAAAQAKLSEYDRFLKHDRFNDLRRSQAAARYGEGVEWLRTTLATIEARSSSKAK